MCQSSYAVYKNRRIYYSTTQKHHQQYKKPLFYKCKGTGWLVLHVSFCVDTHQRYAYRWYKQKPKISPKMHNPT